MKTWKAYAKLTTIAALSLCAISCSSDKNQTSKQKQQTAIFAERAELGAIYQGRKLIPMSSPLVHANYVSAQGRVVNTSDFLKQVANVRAYATGITNRYAYTYGKLNQWISAGAKIEDLKKYNINPRLMRGEDGYQNVLMTGYYIPVIEAKSRPQGAYRYPVHAIPKGNKKYSRAQIYAGALAGQGLELAYSNSLMDNFLMEVQGSGFMRVDGQLRHFAYGDKNGYSYTSIGRLLVEDGEIPKEKMSIQAIKEWAARNPSRLQSLLERNQSYVYFRHDPTFDVKGSAGVPLVALASVASDTSLIPSGSVLLVEMPLIDNKGKWTGKHELRLMVALDRGGAVKGQHFDLYQGIGDKAGHTAGHLKHYGRVWVLN